MVVDASWCLAYLLPDEARANQVKGWDEMMSDFGTELCAPRLLSYEVGNALQMNVVRKRLEKTVAGEIFGQYLQLRITYQRVDYDEVFQISLEFGLTYYDAAYVWMALKNKAELLTLDKEMKKVWMKLKSN